MSPGAWQAGASFTGDLPEGSCVAPVQISDDDRRRKAEGASPEADPFLYRVRLLRAWRQSPDPYPLPGPHSSTPLRYTVW